MATEALPTNTEACDVTATERDKEEGPGRISTLHCQALCFL